jgi:hypothetical protein
MGNLGCQGGPSSPIIKQWTCQARPIFAGPHEISQFAGHGAFFGMPLADIAPHHPVSRMSWKADTPYDNGINIMI